MADTPDAGKSVGTDAPTADERKALLKRAVKDQIREARADLRSQGDFEAVIVRGRPINHQVHLVAVVVMAALAVFVGAGFHDGPRGIAKAAVVPAAYALWWLFLTLTGGEQLDVLSVDEQGKISSVKSGRDPETRGDLARTAIPVLVIGVAGWIAIGLIHDITFPPQPNCNVQKADRPDACFDLPNLSVLVYGSPSVSQSPAPSATEPAPTPSPGTSSSAAPSASAPAAPSAAPSASADPAATAGVGFNIEQTQIVERIVRCLQLVVALAVLVGASWFLRRMRTGRWVGFIRPVHHRLSDG